MTPLMAFGLMLILGSLSGYIAHRLSWLPSITGFMVIGFLIGPSGIGLLDPQALVESRVLIDIALALILYRLGLSLDLSQLRRSPRLLVIALAESTLTFAAVFFGLHLFNIPSVLAALIAAITVSSSPAVLLHVAHELDARGPVTESSLTLVALNNLFSFLAFSAVLPLLHHSNGADWSTIIFHPLYGLIGSILLGIVLATGLFYMTFKTREAGQYRLALIIGTIILSVGLAGELNLSSLLVPLVIGLMVKNLEHDRLVSEIEFGSPFEFFFIILFVYAGAGLHLDALMAFAPVVLTLVLARSLAKVIAVSATSSCFRQPFRAGVSGGILLIPMAGLAIGLVQTSHEIFPQYTDTLSAIVLGAVTVFETVGPPIAGFAFRFCGEAMIHSQKNSLS